MCRQRAILLILLASSAVLAALGNVLGSVAADRVPLFLKANAPLLFASAFLVDIVVSVALERLQRAERRPLRQVLAYLLIVVSAGSAALGGVESNLVATTLPQALQSRIVPNAWLLLLAVALLTSVANAVAYSLSAVFRLTPDNRTAFLSMVSERYTNRLGDTLGDAARIELHLREDARAQALTQPALARQALGDGPAGLWEAWALPAGTPISSVYDEAQEELLILGEPGSGKTTLLVELAVALVGRAEKSKQLKLPVIFSLASWAIKRLPLSEWMAAELAETYQVPPKLADAWMEADAVLPLLDGLDEVAEEHRGACAQQIDQYHREHALVPLVVCSRRREYFMLPTRLHLRTAVRLQPLTAAQIENYLAQGEGLAGLRDALAGDRRLCTAARTPLMLSVMALTYQGMRGEEIPRLGNRAAWRHRLFDAYVLRMYHRQRGTSELEGRRGRQAGWQRLRQPLRLLGARGRAETPACTLEQTIQYLAWLAAQMRTRGQPEFYLERMQWDWLPEESAPGREPIELTGSVWWSWRGMAGGLILGLFFGLFFGLFLGLNFLPSYVPSSGPGAELVGRLGGGLVVWQVVVLVAWLILGLILGLIGGLYLGLYLGLIGGLVNERDVRQPGEGIQSSGWTGLIGGLGVGLIGALAGGLIGGLIGELYTRPYHGLIGGLIGGLVAGMSIGWVRLGGSAYMQHRKLQRQLEKAGAIPRRYVRFLDFCAEHILLQRIGGGYRFIHALLLDYFADRWVESGGTEPTGVLAEQVSHHVSL